jgi:exodeoxyribonuclease-1
VIERHARRLQAAGGLAEKVRQVHLMTDFPPETDPDLMIYSGGFFPDADRREMARLQGLGPDALAAERFAFEDSRLPEMLFRYRARNWPQTLNEREREDWDAYRLERLTDPHGGGSIAIDEYHQRLMELRAEEAGDRTRTDLLDQLEQWAERVMDASG